LIPSGDPTTLFISAGMQPLQPYYRGVEEPPAPRLASSQKCFRTGDLEEVGDDRHNTFFEMLGNFAPTGAYFKETAIPLAWELVVDGLQLPVERLRVTTHPTDGEAREVWRRETGVRPEWIYENEENWWGLASGLGPCGPDSEIWWDRGADTGCGQRDCYPDHCDRFLEFWNLVFPQFDRQPDGSLPPLPKPAIDTGMGLERITAIVQGRDSVFDTDLFGPILEWARQNSREPNQVSERVIADHARGMTFLIADGVLPAKEGRGYVLRRLIRRAALHARRMGLERPLGEAVAPVVEVMGDHYSELGQRADTVREQVNEEQKRFLRTLDEGMELFESIAARHGSIPGEDAFKLHDTFGFPLELTRELAAERKLAVDEAGFAAAMEEQRTRSRTIVAHSWPDLGSLPRSQFTGYGELSITATVIALRREGQAADRATEGDEVEVFLDRTPFYGESGGQVGDTGTLTGPAGSVRVDDAQKPAPDAYAHLGRVTIGSIAVGETVRAEVDAERRHRVARHHSATHLLHRALQEVLNAAQPLQRGSWVGPDHTTFDFPLNRALTAEERERIRGRMTEQVRAALPFHESQKKYSDAVAGGAMHLFEEKYGDVVRVVCFGDWTCELCGGTHVSNSADVGNVLVLSESSIGSGVRRIDLAVGDAADAAIRRREEELRNEIADLRRELRAAERRIESLEQELNRLTAKQLAPAGRLVEHEVSDPATDLKAFADSVLEIQPDSVVLITRGEQYVLKVPRSLADRYDATRLKEFLGPGGGRPELVQGKLSVPREQAVAKLLELTR
jgi:alanyl-tRNA synthetase